MPKLFARMWPRLRQTMDRRGMTEHRRALLAGLSGQVVEVGAGDGANFAHYPPAVARVLAVEPEALLRRHAATSAAAAPVPVEVLAGSAARLPALDASVDAVVFCLVLCSIPDVGQALAEARRVLRPGGELRFLEHGRADSPGLVRMQRALDATIWPPLAGGCHTGRDTVALLEGAGFTVTGVHRYNFPPVRTPWSFHARGSARQALHQGREAAGQGE
ncbi:class I SAM-dependent methyltransferase [Herbidospora daliensis]|uniref:class I SAM-dependent methyltransferase n=1 Tax=Herbidospora daliensis TaxID=295585 RepID=UPI00078420A7|nr:class I SAM-dependent methyltransferase [Herbidospora daliensis]